MRRGDHGSPMLNKLLRYLPLGARRFVSDKSMRFERRTAACMRCQNPCIVRVRASPVSFIPRRNRFAIATHTTSGKMVAWFAVTIVDADTRILSARPPTRPIFLMQSHHACFWICRFFGSVADSARTMMEFRQPGAHCGSTSVAVVESSFLSFVRDNTPACAPYTRAHKHTPVSCQRRLVATTLASNLRT